MSYPEFEFIKTNTVNMHPRHHQPTMDSLQAARKALLRHATAIHNGEEDALPKALMFLRRVISKYAESDPQTASAMTMMHLQALIEYADKDLLELERLMNKDE